jgi:hypothetical protein
MATTRPQTTPSNKETIAHARSPHTGLPSRSPNHRCLPLSAVRHVGHTSVTTHRVLIQPTHRNASRQFYRATFNGEEIVAQSWDPEFAACRTLKARGLSGRVEFFRAGVPHPCLIVRDLAEGAGLRSYEDDCRGPVLKKWQPIERDGVVPGDAPSAEAPRAAFAN